MRKIMSLINRIGLVSIGLTLILCPGEALAEVVAVVSAQSPLTTLSRNQVVDIFLGRMSRFPDGEQAVPIDQEEGTEARDEFYTGFAELSPAQVKAHWSKIIFTGRGLPPKTVSNSIEVKKAVVKNPNAIGYIERSLVDHSVKVLLSQ
jgi:ABC-type phosphate transport system substrate-binding protein